MTSSFNFGFSGDDIEGDEQDASVDLNGDEESINLGPQLLNAQTHSLEDLVRRLFLN
jgi:hypothetical protein